MMSDSVNKVRDASESSRTQSTHVVLPPTIQGDDATILVVENGNNNESELHDSALKPRVTRLLYFYFMLGFFMFLIICIIWGFVAISYIWSGYPAIGVAYLCGLFIPSVWAVSLLIFDLIIWKRNRVDVRKRLVIDLNLCCGAFNIAMVKI
eukprot:788821_1